MDPKGIMRSLVAVGILVLLIAALLAWQGFRAGYFERLFHNQVVDTKAATQTNAETTDSQKELEAYLRVHDQTARRKEQAVANLGEATRPRVTDDQSGQAAAQRRYDAWYDGVGRLCPLCAQGETTRGLEDSPSR